MNLQEAIDAAYPNAIVQVPSGVYLANLHIRQPVTLLALGEVVIDGAGQGSVVRVDCEGAGLVRLAGFALVNGVSSEAGGGVCVLKGSVELKKCTLRFNKAPGYGGGAVYAAEGKLVLKACRLEANTGRQGGGVLADGESVVELFDSLVLQNAAVQGGGLRAKEGATIRVAGCTVADNKVVSGPNEVGEGGAIYLSATTTRAPKIVVVNSIIAERTPSQHCIFNAPSHPGVLEVHHSLLPTSCHGLGSDNVFDDPRFLYSGDEPYQLKAGSPASNRADVTQLSTERTDVLGAPRGSTPALGAFA